MWVEILKSMSSESSAAGVCWGIMATSCSASGYTEPILLHILATYMCPQANNPANTCPYNLNVLEFNGILAALLLPTLLL